MNNQSIRQYYSDDHDRLDGLFRRFQELKRADTPSAKQLFAQFKAGLERHIVWEEEILFPLFEARTGMCGCGPTAVMRLEHQQIKQHLAEIARRLGRDELAIESEEDALLGVLGMHNEKEENILYPIIDQVVTEQERDEVFARMEQTPSA